MPRKITVTLSEASINEAIRRLDEYKEWLAQKARLLCERLAYQGAVRVSLGYAAAIYTGDKDYDVTVEEIPNGYRILADGETALILEFGAGATFGYGHPDADTHGMGPGTYPDGKGHWNDPNGWYIPGSHGQHTYGNPPSMAMYTASKEMRESVEKTAREVFRS